MKLEKISENQIRCTLTKSDLQNREIKISELAYGSEKAKSLFREMMQQASYEFGFEAEDIPLMIEAVPLSAESIVLTITKVEDPEELDTRFAKFSPAVHSSMDEELEEMLDSSLPDLEEIEAATPQHKPSFTERTQASKADASVSKAIFFTSLDDLLTATAGIAKHPLKTMLFKDVENTGYILYLEPGQVSATLYTEIFSHLLEYGNLVRMKGNKLYYLEEHCETLIEEDAIKKLAQMG